MPNTPQLPATATTPATATRTPRIFVSHSHVDEVFALRLAADFERAGAFVWVDKHDIKAGDFLKRINEGLAQCDWLVLVETADSLVSPAVEMEVNAAQNRVLYRQMRDVIRVIAGPRDPRIVPPLWATLQYYDATVDYAAAVATTLAAIRDGDARWAAQPSASSALPLPPPAPVVAPTSPAERLRALVATAYAANDWHTVVDRTDLLLLPDHAAHVTADDQRMRGRALLELARPDEATAALKAAYDADPYDLPTIRAYARACRASQHQAEAEPLLKRALALADDNETRLDILREYVPTLQTLNRWDEALSRSEQALLLRPNDPGWLRQRLDALTTLGRHAEALELAEQLTTRADASASDWLTLARLTRTAHPSPPDASDATVRARIAHALDAADRLAAQSAQNAQNAQSGVIRSAPPQGRDWPGAQSPQGAADPSLAAALAQARRDLLPPPAPPLALDQFPQRLADLGFVPQKLKGVAVIIPPLSDPITAGPFLMGSDPRRDRQARADEQPQHSVTLAAYHIGRFPVTVAEYDCYLRATSAAARGNIGKLDHPIVNVSWHDAVAYAAWLAQTTGQPWRLPTEAEWEKAARGADGRIYPWGDAWDKTRANTSDGGAGTTTRVGSYPSGASPYGAQDMAGNVWEWCSSLYQAYPSVANDGRENLDSTGNRILRGGSWDFSSGVARAAYRYGSDPRGSDDVGGFRVARGVGAGAS